jgi:hypothetical protein
MVLVLIFIYDLISNSRLHPPDLLCVSVAVTFYNHF